MASNRAHIIARLASMQNIIIVMAQQLQFESEAFKASSISTLKIETADRKIPRASMPKASRYPHSRLVSLHNLNLAPCHCGKSPPTSSTPPVTPVMLPRVHPSIAMSLPTPRLFITQLLGSLPSSPSQSGDSRNPLSAVPETARKQLLSLQVLFPNEFLPALDLLDRRLVTRLVTSDGGGETVSAEKEAIIAHAQNNNNNNNNHAINEPATQPSAALDTCTSVNNTLIPSHPPPNIDVAPTPSLTSLFYVRSAQPRSSRSSTSYDSTTSYQVRLRAWNCSCPAFAFAAYAAVHPEPAIPVHDGHASPAEDETRGHACMFGGVSLGDTVPPVCKHLLACVLVEKCGGLFGGFVEERVVGVEEAAGWAAGWGDS